MRDVNRIDKIMSRLNYLWHYCPDFRFWQLICLVVGYLPKQSQADPFYVEDDKWLMAIEYAIDEYKPESEEE